MDGGEHWEILQRSDEDAVAAHELREEREEEESAEEHAHSREPEHPPPSPSQCHHEEPSESGGNHRREEHAELMDPQGDSKTIVERGMLGKQKERSCHESECARILREAIEGHGARELSHETRDGDEVAECEEERETATEEGADCECPDALSTVRPVQGNVAGEHKEAREEGEKYREIPPAVEDNTHEEREAAGAHEERCTRFPVWIEEQPEEPPHERYGEVDEVAHGHVEQEKTMRADDERK